MDKLPFKVLLIIPPCYLMDFPPLGTPALTGFLKSKGIKVSQLDLNIEFHDYLKKERKEYIFSEDYRLNKIRQGVYYRRELKYRNEFGPARIFAKFPPSSFDFTEKMLSSPNLTRFIDDEKENVFYQFFQSQVMPRIIRAKYAMVGFSILAPSQVIASFTFCRMLKARLADTKIVIGGPWVSLFKEQLLERNDFSAFYDFLIYFEGETPLYSLIDKLINKQPLLKTPNLIYKYKGGFILTNEVSAEDMDKLPCPDFSGLPLTRYANSDNGKLISLTFETARGCYWGRCIFCDDISYFRPGYREKNTRLVIEDIKVLEKRYKFKILMISNTVFSPWQIREFASRLLKENIKIKWWAMVRFEKEFTRELLTLAKRSGCSKLLFGLESVNQRVLDFCNKGIKVGVVKRIMQDVRRVGLGASYQVIVGIPNETLPEALNTVLLSLNQPYEFTFNYYYQIPKMYTCNNPRKYGLLSRDNSKLPFKFYRPFRNKTKGIEQIESEEINKFQHIVYRILTFRGKRDNKKNPRISKSFLYGRLKLFLQGSKYERLSRYDKAVEAFSRISASFPDSGDIYVRLANDYFYLKDYLGAGKMAQKAIALGFRDGHFILGYSYEKLHKYKDAVRELEKAEKIRPKDSSINFLLSRCHRLLGQREKCINELEKGLAKHQGLIKASG